MIQKARIGRGFRGVLRYVFDDSAERGHARAAIVATNMAGRSPRELTAEFGALRRLNPDLTRAVYHCSLRLPAAESLSDDQWGAFSRDYLGEMGFAETPYVVARHAEDHVHLIASRVRFDGRTVPDGNERWRSNRVVYGLEEKYHLAHARDPERAREPRPQLSRDEIARAERVGEVPAKLVLAARIDAAVARSDGTREGFETALDALGVTTHWNVASTGRVQGASYQLRDAAGATRGIFKGSRLGKDYGWGRLGARLDERQRERADGRTDDAIRREDGPLATTGARDPAPAPDGSRAGDPAERGTPTARTETPEAHRADGRSPADGGGRGAGPGRGADADHQGDRAAAPDGGRRDGDGDALHAGAGGLPGRAEAGAERLDERLVPDRRAGAAGAGRDAPVGERDSATATGDGGERAAAVPGGGGGGGGAGARDRADGGYAARDRATAPVDRTTAAVRGQLAAMGCDRYEVGVRDPRRGMLTHQGSADAIAAGIGWLKAMNARGSDIFVRPAGSSGVVLLDDLSARALKQLERDGLAPAAVTETGAGNYQAWMRLSNQPLLPDVQTEAARELAERYGGDPRSAEWCRYGRLAGFTNQEEHTRADGHQPAVRLTGGREGSIPHAAAEVLARAQERFEGRLQAPRPVPPPSPMREHPGSAGQVLATPEVVAARTGIRERDGGRADR